jgi:HSP20 family protein
MNGSSEVTREDCQPWVISHPDLCGEVRRKPDAWREGDRFIVEFDLPGVDEDSLDLDVERNVLTVHAKRPDLDPDREMVSAERPRGVFSRQLFLGETLDAAQIEASYGGGVLRLTIPVAEKAKPRRIKIASEEKQAINA